MLIVTAVSAAAPVAEALDAVSSGEFSFVRLFINADPIVKGVMGMLIIASIWSWAIILDKQFQFASLKRRARQFEDSFWSGRSLDDLVETHGTQPREPMGRIFAAAMREWRESRGRGRDSGALMGAGQRIDRVMGLVVARELTAVEKGLGVLASVGSASPFIGLFGTVWGIMNSFRAIAASRDTNLAVVAPGIAEALFATALGLVAAVPAVIFYNKFATDAANYGTQLQGFSDELGAVLSRRTEERGG